MCSSASLRTRDAIAPFALMMRVNSSVMTRSASAVFFLTMALRTAAAVVAAVERCESVKVTLSHAIG